MLISAKQYDLLLGFYAHCYCVYHESAVPDFNFWAEQLDFENVPFSVQNTVAVTAEEKESISLYLRTHLKKKGIYTH
ncbi:MAG: hypothetical protein V7749_00910 [Cocleimonas sp.]